jgi:hypothetical protein
MTFERLLSIWWSFFWRSAIATPVFGFVLGALVGIVVRLAGLPGTRVGISITLGCLATIPASFWAIYATLKKHRLQPVPEYLGDQPASARREPRFDN